MCGIIGVASTGILVENDKKYFRQALFCDQLRGVDSTGIFSVNKNPVPEVNIFKRAYPAHDFLDMKPVDRMIGALGSTRVMVGHNRAATKGSVNNSNAHPFQFGDITMVHNGTLLNYSRLPGYTYAENDSKLLCRGIAELGIQGAIDCIEGAWSLVWHDAIENTLNFLRNGQRPMALASNKGRKDLYFASELMMLDWLTARNSIVVDEILNTQVNQHIKLSLDEAAFNPVIKEVVRKKIHYSAGTGGQSKKPANDKNVGQQGEQNVKARDTLLASKLREIESEGTPVPRVGMKCKAYMYNITPYKSSSKLGVMLGTMTKSPWLTCELHNQKVANFAEGYYEFQVCGQRIEGGLATGCLELLGHAPRLVGGKADHPLEVLPKVVGNNDKAVEVNKTIVKKPLSELAKKLTASSVKLGSRPVTLTLVTQTPNSTNKAPLASVSINDWRAQQKKHSAPKVIEHDVGSKIMDGLIDEDDHGYDDVDVAIDPDFPYVGADGCFLSQDVYDTLTRHGCCQCSGNISDDDAPDLLWVDTVSPLCLSCQAEQEYGGSMNVDLMIKQDMKDDGCPELPDNHKLH